MNREQEVHSPDGCNEDVNETDVVFGGHFVSFLPDRSKAALHEGLFELDGVSDLISVEHLVFCRGESFEDGVEAADVVLSELGKQEEGDDTRP